MKRLTLATAAIAALATAIAIPVLADGKRDDDRWSDRDHAGFMGQSGPGGMMGQSGPGGMMGQSGPGAMMGGDMGQMMRMMQMMHGGQNGMMGAGGFGGGMMGSGGFGAGMMGGANFMQGAFDTDGDGTVTPDELQAGLLGWLNTYDADGNGTLSLSEFEALHAAQIRELTVDRFQALDADGDGQVTADEITAPADAMQAMMGQRSGQSQDRMPMMDGSADGATGGNGMMNNNSNNN